ncbi:hypothetical protein LEN26_000239 [Aphanomyces euteiches]|nr:hypothetical protein LEN26_000239 [Aphanomyces euteiches]KAH9188496.1 hypothetical protein AeNC1_009530 [Aphanomyces euteiches]
MKIHPEVRWIYSGREVYGELVDEGIPDAPPRGQRKPAATSSTEVINTAIVAAITDEEKTILNQVEREHALAETSVRLGLVLCHRLGIDTVATVRNILQDVLDERCRNTTEASVAEEDHSTQLPVPARRSERTSVPARKKGKARKCWSLL